MLNQSKFYTTETKQQISFLANQGVSSRYIAEALGISKSGVNDYINRDKPHFRIPNARVLVYDLETSAAEVLTFGRFKQNIGQANVLKEGGMILCASYRWLDTDKTFTMHLTPDEIKRQDDSRLVAWMFDLYEQADAVLAHNSRGFDHKVLQTRALKAGFPALPMVKVLDSLQLARRYLKLPSNRLDAIGEYFGLGRKQETGGISLWRDVQAGDTAAMKRMVEYCKQDTNLLYEVYLKLRGLGATGNFDASLFSADKSGTLLCKSCGSADIHATGRVVATGANNFVEHRCNNCGGVQRSKQKVVWH